MPIDHNLHRSSGFRRHEDADYEDDVASVLRSLPQARILTCADEPRFSFGNPAKHSFWEEVKAWEECIANGGRPG